MLYRVNLSINLGYTADIEAESEDEAINQAKTEAETVIANSCDNVDYVDIDDSSTVVSDPSKTCL